MALQEVCGFRDTPIYPKWDDLASFFTHGGDTAMHFHGGISSDLSGRGFPLWLYTPVQEYLTQSPLEFGQIRPSVSPSHFLPSSPPSLSLPSSLPPSLSPHSTSVSLPFPLSHGTTTLAFVFSGGIIAAADTRSSCAGLVACPASDKVVPVHSHLVGTTSGTSADCFVWKRILARELRLYALRHRRRLSIRGAAKLLSNMLHPFKGTELCVAATLCGWDLEDGEVRVEVQGGEGRREKKEVKKEEERSVGTSEAMDGASEMQRKTEKTKKERSSSMERGASSQLSTRGQHSSPEGEAGCNDPNFSTRGHPNIAGETPLHPRSGPSLHYVCSDGSFLKGELFSVGSGSPYAYSVLDGGMLRGMGVAEACRLAREAVYRATHRDAYSGNCVDLYHVTAQGWRRREREDLKEEFYREREREREKVEERKREREMGRVEERRKETEGENVRGGEEKLGERDRL